MVNLFSDKAKILSEVNGCGIKNKELTIGRVFKYWINILFGD
jgi:hypothetical protein